MYIPKRYGQSKTASCPFCGKPAIARNRQGLNVCTEHKDKELPLIRCVCGSVLEIKAGKYGPYFNCINCGNINLKKGLEMMEMQKSGRPKLQKDESKPEIKEEGKYPGFDYGID
ncbi:MAG: hypothetical protein KKF44_00370 [Nanoarchaeota archaeon]|nr:hypothetical protein [Nanoarchaeota archaeon]